VVLSDGMRVRVVAVPDDEPGYAGCVGREGAVEGHPSEWGGATWVYVKLDGDPVASEFKVEEVEPVNMRVYEDVVEAGCGTWWLNTVSADELLAPYEGKRIRLTIEEVPHAND
jgi:hypothetical protein